MLNIVIPVADIVVQAQDLLEGLLYSIEQQQITDIANVYVCFDQCREEFVENFIRRYTFIKAVVNTGNRLNFTGNVNLALRPIRAKGESALIVNQDCVLPSRDLISTFTKITGGIVSAAQVTLCKEPPIDYTDLQLLHASQPKQVDLTEQLKVTGFCLYIPSQILQDVGVLDEYFKAGFDDDDYCARVRLRGYKVYQSNINVHHYVSRCGAYTDLSVPLGKFYFKYSIPYTVEHKDFAQWIETNHKWQEGMLIQ